MPRNYEPAASVGMLAAVEHGPILCSDSNILCLSWKGRVPKSEKDKPVCRRRYYEEGWLATGNGRGVVGVTFTSSHCRRDRSTPQRINFNLRGHNSEVVLVRWNEPFQKLATCDMEGGIFVWIQYEGRWSVELVNDRGAQVSDFTWSHDGTQALIAYRDGFVLVGSVSGQRHWSSEINLESQITCGIWTPDDQQVLFGTADGQVIVMDCHGRMLAHVLLHESDGIVSMSWNCPDFLVEDSTESDTDSDDSILPIARRVKPLLTVTFLSGDISLMNNYDDLSPAIIRSGLKDVEAQWCSQGDLLAVAGMERHIPSDTACASIMRNALVKFYNVQGEHIYTLETPAQRPITTICWGHRDSRLFLACGPALYVVRVEHRVASLQLLCQQGIASALREEKDVGKLNMPSLLCSYVTTAFIPTIKPPIPDPNNIRDFVSYPTSGNERLHCTMKRAEDSPEAGGPCYTLYLEYLGGLVPILKGRRISKLRPEFVIMDPKTDSKADDVCVNPIAFSDSCNCSDSSDIELSDEWVSKKSPKLSRGHRINLESRKSPKLSRANQEVVYKTSLLHLQPRQMTIYLPEVRKISHDFMSLPVFNPNVFSEDEDDLPVMGPSGVAGDNPPCTVNIPIAPIHSPAQAMSPTQSIGLVQSLLANQNIQLDVLTNPTANAAAAAAAAAASVPHCPLCLLLTIYRLSHKDKATRSLHANLHPKHLNKGRGCTTNTNSFNNSNFTNTNSFNNTNSNNNTNSFNNSNFTNTNSNNNTNSFNNNSNFTNTNSFNNTNSNFNNNNSFNNTNSIFNNNNNNNFTNNNSFNNTNSNFNNINNSNFNNTNSNSSNTNNSNFTNTNSFSNSNNSSFINSSSRTNNNFSNTNNFNFSPSHSMFHRCSRPHRHHLKLFSNSNNFSSSNNRSDSRFRK
uniref:IFT121/TULP4 N-terminal domain-containing protein n=1 Tax=Knipowitschia caucasica TaxID=637954 RepID=A0AAV2JDH5_KNICA